VLHVNFATQQVARGIRKMLATAQRGRHRLLHFIAWLSSSAAEDLILQGLLRAGMLYFDVLYCM
jgi:hypothetical protein